MSGISVAERLPRRVPRTPPAVDDVRVPDRLDPATVDVVTDEFCGTYGSRAARIAFYGPATSTSTHRGASGASGPAPRRSTRRPCSCVGGLDRLVPPAFARHVGAALPAADQVVLRDRGHVPQVELAGEANRLVRAHIEAASRRPGGAEAATAGLARSA